MKTEKYIEFATKNKKDFVFLYWKSVSTLWQGRYEASKNVKLSIPIFVAHCREHVKRKFNCKSNFNSESATNFNHHTLTLAGERGVIRTTSLPTLSSNVPFLYWKVLSFNEHNGSQNRLFNSVQLRVPFLQTKVFPKVPASKAGGGPHAMMRDFLHKTSNRVVETTVAIRPCCFTT